MALSKISAMRSKDPVTKVGSCIVNEKKRVVGLGYNGMPLGNDENFSWKKEINSVYKNKYYYVIHAEMNAILNSVADLKNTTIYTSFFPCSSCAKVIVQSGIKKVFFEKKPNEKTPDFLASEYIFKVAKIQLKEIKFKQILLK